MWDGGLELPLLYSQQACQELLIFLNGAQEDATNDVTLFVFADYFPDGLRVEGPDFMGDEGRVC